MMVNRKQTVLKYYLYDIVLLLCDLHLFYFLSIEVTLFELNSSNNSKEGLIANWKKIFTE